MSNTSTNSTSQRRSNPYETLSIKNFATPSEVKKRFRELSLKFHPDKRKKNLTQSQNDEQDKQFIAVREARDFLLNGDHKAEKDEFDRMLKSEMFRKMEEKSRDAAMSSNRKRMRNDLETKIQNLRKSNDVAKSEEDGIEGLRRDGKRMREGYWMGKRSAEEKFVRRERNNRKANLENRQVRVKWSRKKMGSQSDDMIAILLSRFGIVERVELIGSKGNSALVTFCNASCCKPCVDFYLSNDEMRASYVGKRNTDQDIGNNIPRESMRRKHDRESVEERNLRHAAEREALLRKIEMGVDQDEQNEKAFSKTSKRDSKLRHLFPPPFPASDECPPPSCLERLQQFERSLLVDILTSDEIEEMQIPECY